MKLNLPVSGLPNIFIQVVKQKKLVKFSTEELINLNNRQRDSVAEILQLSNRILEMVFHELRSNIGCIYSLNDTTSLLDMLLSFTTFTTLIPSVRPIITHRDTLEIKEGRHPILSTYSDRTFVANDTNCSKTNNFQIITGSNMSGKSTYIRQISLIVILAHIGCFVTAESALIRLTDHIFSRIGTSDCIEDNASSFMLEMREMAYIIQNKTPNSLIIIDELGRGTSLNDACSLAWSCAEDLIASNSFTFFVTHFLQLTNLSTMYNNVSLSHLETIKGRTHLEYNHQLKAGVENIDHFGIHLAQFRAGFPEEVITFANTISKQLQTMETDNQNTSKSKRIHQIVEDVKALKESTLDWEDIASILQNLRSQAIQLLNEK